MCINIFFWNEESKVTNTVLRMSKAVKYEYPKKVNTNTEP